MKSLMSLLQSVLADASIWCRTSTTHDFETVMRRVEHEGISFLTITLPTFSRDLERALDEGVVGPHLFTSFRKKGRLPLFLGGFCDLVFDRSSGQLLDCPSITAIYFIRQISLLFKKILLDCSSEREKSAYGRYVECEYEVKAWTDSNHDSELVRDFDRVSDLLWSSDLCRLDRKVYDGDLRPKHGKGSTADRIFGNAKYEQRTWTERLEEYFPAGDFIIPNAGFFDRLNPVDYVEPGAEMPVRVITVPKTLKTPRIIAMEPTCMQYAQQSLLIEIVSALERSKYLADSIGFTDQTPNQRMAREGSVDGSLATLDLSDASDRVSNLLVTRLLRRFPHLAGAVDACRSRNADVPGHGIIHLSKFASMGSALCFPMEAMVFLTIILIGIEKELSCTLSKSVIKQILPKVRVYGDDIIVPIEYVQSVMSSLHLYGCKVNTAKSFWTGKFRESCGRDYYDGEDVTVVYCRREFPTSWKNASEMISLVKLRNAFYKAGLWKTAEFLDHQVRGLAPFPNVLEESPVVGRHTFLGFESQRMCSDLHKPLVKGMVVSSRLRSSNLDDYGALLKFFIKVGLEPVFDAKHLERSGRPESVDIKIRWASAT